MTGDILAFDPGDITGIAVFTSTGELKGMYQVPLEGEKGLIAWLHDYAGLVSMCIVEEFVLYTKKARQQGGSRMKASQAIGAIKTFAHGKGADVVEQRSDIKPMALGWSQIKMPTVHSQTHQFDAYLHGYYWLVKNGIIKTKLQQQKGRI